MFRPAKNVLIITYLYHDYQLDILNTLKKIWLEEVNHEINRVYNFEQSSPNSQISIFVAIK